MKLTSNGIAIIEGDSHLSKWILEQGRLDVDGSARELSQRFIRPGDSVVDGGACLGDHTCVYLESVGDTGKVIAFEPNPVAFECLVHNCPKADHRNVALGRMKGTGNMAMVEDNHGAAQVSVSDGPVTIVPLDSFYIPKLTFIKLDIEGMELEALNGAVNTLRIMKPVVVAELNPPLLIKNGATAEDVILFMKSLGYRWEFRDKNYGFDQVHTDVIFTHSWKK